MRLTPDAARYLHMASGKGPAQFRLRWLIPRLCRRNVRAWTAVTCLSLAAASVLTGVLAYQHTGSGWRALAACLLFAGLPMVRFLWFTPILVDAPGIALALASAVTLGEGWWWVAVPLAVLAGCVRETGPVFAALFAWHPLPLIGLAAVAVRYVTSKPCPDVLDAEQGWVLDHPFLAARKYHADEWRDPHLMVLPWGGCLAALAHPNPWLAGTVIVAYLQLLCATDSVRLYQWAAPVVCVAAVTNPLVTLPALIVAHWFNPWAGNGV